MPKRHKRFQCGITKRIFLNIFFTHFLSFRHKIQGCNLGKKIVRFIFKSVYCSSIFFCWSAGAFIAIESSAFCAEIEFLFFVFGRYVVNKLTDKFCRNAIFNYVNNSVSVAYRRLFDGYYFARLYIPRWFYRNAVNYYSAFSAFIGGNASCFVNSHSPKIFIDAYQGFSVLIFTSLLKAVIVSSSPVNANDLIISIAFRILSSIIFVSSSVQVPRT